MIETLKTTKASNSFHSVRSSFIAKHEGRLQPEPSSPLKCIP